MIAPGAHPGMIVGGRYELVEIAGSGGMANVWRAIQHGPGRFGRTVAVKQLQEHLASDPRYVEMFLEEARVGSLLEDSNVARVQDFFEDHGELWLVLEWIEGIDLATYIHYVIATGQQPQWELITAVGIGMLRGLAAAHEYVTEDGQPGCILHRDVSPHNVLISVKGPARLIDFGLALASDRMMAPTPPGTAKGKLAYLSPEIARGEPATAASDQFAAGSVLWEALAGRKLFDGADQAEVFRKLATGDVTSIEKARSDLPRKLVKILDRALAVDPGARFPSARAMAMALGEVLKSAQSRVDLYQLLARTVIDARTALDMGRRTRAIHMPEVQEEASDLAILLPFTSAWRRLRSVLPAFLGGEQPQPQPPRRALTAGGSTPPSERRRAGRDGVMRLLQGEEAQSGPLVIRCAALDLERTPTESVARVDVVRDGTTEQLTLFVPGQVVVADHLLSALSRDGDRLALRADPIGVGRSLLVFPHLQVTIGGLRLTVTGVDPHKAFLRLERPGALPEHTIAALPARGYAVIERPGYRIAIEKIAPPWVMLRVDSEGG